MSLDYTQAASTCGTMAFRISVGDVDIRYHV